MSDEFKNNIIHLRIAFSFFLMPVFWFALWQGNVHDLNLTNTLILFFVLHVLVYPSSNGYNSYMDNDTESIGGIKCPPKVPKSMFMLSIMLDTLALGLTFYFCGAISFVLLFVYILASRAYSYRGIRLKKYPIIGFLTVAIFQGCVIYCLIVLTVFGHLWLDLNLVLGASISFLLVGAGYPLTQVYQHKQDREDNVETMSLLLGVKGTFVFSSVLFALLGIGLGLFFLKHDSPLSSYILLAISLAPVLYVFNTWMFDCFKDVKHASFERTMKMNKIGALGLNLFFVLYLIKTNFL
jgi:UbiA prenyltransferase family